jgi:hypothetical protein
VKFRNLTFVLLVLFVFRPPSLWGQAKASLAGVVVNSGTGDPIPNVQVKLGRTDVHLGPFGDMVAADHPPGEISLPASLLEAIKKSPGVSPADQAMFDSLNLTDVDEIIVSPGGGVAATSKSAPPVQTDNQGRFAFDGIEPGIYRLMFSAAGYARQDYGESLSGSPGTPITLAAGQSKRDIVMRISPVSAISGRILDQTARPIAGVPVQLLRFSYDETGHKKTRRIASTQTDDRGEYRFFFLSPGRYYLRAGDTAGQARPAGTGTENGPFGTTYLSPNRIPQNYSLTYYRDVSDAESAVPISIQAGADLSGFDLFLRPQQTYRVRGRIVDSKTGQPPQSAIILLRPRSADFTETLSFMMGGSNQNYNATDGTFEMRNVPSGTYTLNVELPNLAPGPRVDINAMSPSDRAAYVEAMAAQQQARPRAAVNISVSNSDVDGVAVSVAATGSISGRFRTDPLNASSAVQVNFLRLQLNDAEGGAAALSDSPAPASIHPDGTFVINGIPAGEYRLAIAGIPSGFYLKAARLGQSDVLNSPLRLSAAESYVLDIVISPNAGQIEGIAVGVGDQTAPGAQVVLIPDANRTRTELFRSVTADASGHFSISAIVPGDYRLAAWNAIEPYAFFDPELIRQAEQNGTVLHVTESSKQTVNVRAW